MKMYFAMMMVGLSVLSGCNDSDSAPAAAAATVVKPQPKATPGVQIPGPAPSPSVKPSVNATGHALSEANSFVIADAFDYENNAIQTLYSKIDVIADDEDLVVFRSSKELYTGPFIPEKLMLTVPVPPGQDNLEDSWISLYVTCIGGVNGITGASYELKNIDKLAYHYGDGMRAMAQANDVDKDFLACPSRTLDFLLVVQGPDFNMASYTIAKVHADAEDPTTQQ